MTTWQDSFHTDEFPAAWERILQRHVPILGYLSEPDQRELRSYIRWFVGSKNFEGCAGLTITDEIRVVVAAQACLLLLHRETPCYERLHLIRIYPGTHFAVSSVQKLGGESWANGVVLLAWDSVRYGAANPFDGDNIVLHEFAHQLDHEDGQCDGTPLLERGMSEKAGLYTLWAKMLAVEFEKFRADIGKDTAPILRSYGAKNQAEFFAVATECFFEKPRQLRSKQPELYAALKEFYQQDPAAWALGSNTANPADGQGNGV